MICGECKRECGYIIEEGGIGAYEFWGQKGHDSHKLVASDCCGADVLDDQGRVMDPEDLDTREGR